MMPKIAWRKLRVRLSADLRQLTTVNASDRMWQMPFAAALATGLPLLAGAWSGHMAYGLVASLGGLVFMYLPNTPLQHRMVALMACAFAMVACYTLGLLSHFVPAAMMPVLAFIAILATMACRFYGVGPPGSLFFIMAAAIGAYSPVQPLQLPLLVGLVTLGCLTACLVAFFYSLVVLRLQPALPAPPLPTPSFGYVVFDSVVIGVFVGISLALAQALHLEKAYWVPVSCLAVIQAQSLRAVWHRQLHRLTGTAIGLLLSWVLLTLMLPLNPWSLALTMMALTVVIEMVVVRHYGFGAIFITPLAILLAEAATMGQASPALLIQARFIDTVLGCAVGFAGAACLHNPRFRQVAGGYLRRLLPPLT